MRVTLGPRVESCPWSGAVDECEMSRVGLC